MEWTKDFILFQSDTFQISEHEFFIRLLISIGIGLIIGLEREFASHNKKKPELFAGVRTFVMVVMLGFIAAFLSKAANQWILPIAFLSVVIIVSISYLHDVRNHKVGGTTEMVTLLSFLLGAATLFGFITVSITTMVVIVVFLSLKVKIRSIIGQLSHKEVYAFIRFIVLTSLLLPFLPDINIGPYSVINPKEVGWVIVITSGIGFLGYMLVKFLGSSNGILITGLLGGLVSSTMVTWIFAKKSKSYPAIAANCATAILAASTVMVVRVGIWVQIFNKSLLDRLWLPLAIMFIAGLLSSIIIHYRNLHKQEDPEHFQLGEPLNIIESLWFGLLFIGILIFISAANAYLGNEGTYISSAIAGFSDLDAITISISKLGGIDITSHTAQVAIIIATLANTITKFIISLWFGSAYLRRLAAIGYGSILVTGLIGIIYLTW